VNELGAKTTWSVDNTDSDWSYGTLGIDVYEDGYYLVTCEVFDEATSDSKWTDTVFTMTHATGVEGVFASEYVEGFTGEWKQDSDNSIVQLVDQVPTPDYFRSGFSGVFLFNALDVPASDTVFPNRLVALTIKLSGAATEHTMYAKYSVTFIGETLELSRMAEKLQPKGGLKIPKNRAFFHHQHERRRAKATELREEARRLAAPTSRLNPRAKVFVPRSLATDEKSSAAKGASQPVVIAEASSSNAAVVALAPPAQQSLADKPTLRPVSLVTVPSGPSDAKVQLPRELSIPVEGAVVPITADIEGFSLVGRKRVHSPRWGLEWMVADKCKFGSGWLSDDLTAPTAGGLDCTMIHLVEEWVGGLAYHHHVLKDRKVVKCYMAVGQVNANTKVARIPGKMCQAPCYCMKEADGPGWVRFRDGDPKREAAIMAAV
jgi:hypothetical protein